MQAVSGDQEVLIGAEVVQNVEMYTERPVFTHEVRYMGTFLIRKSLPLNSLTPPRLRLSGSTEPPATERKWIQAVQGHLAH